MNHKVHQTEKTCPGSENKMLQNAEKWLPCLDPLYLIPDITSLFHDVNNSAFLLLAAAHFEAANAPPHNQMVLYIKMKISLLHSTPILLFQFIQDPEFHFLQNQFDEKTPPPQHIHVVICACMHLSVCVLVTAWNAVWTG